MQKHLHKQELIENNRQNITKKYNVKLLLTIENAAAEDINEIQT